ncbi:DUF72 domain-containing protein [Acidihalobacter prosperus]
MRKDIAGTGRLYLGTSGWAYAHWRGAVYPEGLPEAQWLAHYAASLSSVEVNGSFYRLPSARTLQGWCAAVPEDFVFALKASAYVTHRKKLREPQRTLPPLLDCAERLGSRLGPLLFQLPPRWRVNAERLDAFLQALPAGRRSVFEFRDPSWFCDEVYALLRQHRAALCRYDLEGRRSPETETADFAYLRLHGPGAAYRGSYADAVLREWAAEITGGLSRGRDVYCYFDNDEAGFAFRDALRLQRMIEEA